MPGNLISLLLCRLNILFIVNMKRIILWASLLALFANESPAQWKPAGDRIKTEWAAKVDPANPLPEYPRPIMQRAECPRFRVEPRGLWRELSGSRRILEPLPCAGGHRGETREYTA